MDRGLTLLGGLAAEDFLAEYWQKKPLLIRGAVPGFVTPLSPDELAGLACEEGVNSRLVLEQDTEAAWQLEYGPFAEDRFAELPASHWTLLVQDVQKFVPELAELLEHFSFIPAWRIDDIMVSYAPRHGSVGPHVDQYDVFLLQGLGRRHWQISYEPAEADNFLPDTPLRIMRSFEADEEWVLEPGDMLYLPPGVPHWGIALEDCMTFSVGFRAPSFADLVTGFAEAMASELSDAQRYTDPDLLPARHPGEISAEALAQVRGIIRGLASDERIDRWYGRFITDPKPGQEVDPLPRPLTPDGFAAKLARAVVVRRNEFSRLAYIRRLDGTALLYADGVEYALGRELAFAAPLLCDQRAHSIAALQPHLEEPGFLALLTTLFNRNAIELDEEHG